MKKSIITTDAYGTQTIYTGIESLYGEFLLQTEGNPTFLNELEDDGAEDLIAEIKAAISEAEELDCDEDDISYVNQWLEICGCDPIPQLTEEQVASELIDQSRLESEPVDIHPWHYYLHVNEDGTLARSFRDADLTIHAPAIYLDDLPEDVSIDDPERGAYCHESLDDPGFMEVVRTLTEAANEWLASIS